MDELKMDQRIRKLRKSQNDILENIKLNKKKKEDQWYAKRKTNEDDFNTKMNRLVRKFKRSAKIVQENQDKFRLETDLKNEKRRLRVNDLNYERERMKQLQKQQKQKIIEKEQKDAEAVQNRQQNQIIVREKLMNSRINELIKRDIFMETIQKVVHDNTSQKIRNKMLQEKKLNLSLAKPEKPEA
uniref:Uncharacterized protein n=1 Tax=Euplotes crassus TaxID=5936 RepID=A0A7S3KC92_EUPCR|mmetsp:Transcript_20463/g.20193  ORF Transcript_20463/g.20193 Transcript_20463/m.20193 type:complete len:185 (+) Transcript_20463:306-860(+)